jgi:predicted DNA-binding transcriptional regulator YafY
MYDPTMRVLTVLEMLQASERVTGAELAAKLEVHPRTAQRYIARLQDLGVPVEGTRGAAGAYRLKPGFRLPPMMFTDNEALALTLGLRALRYLGLTAFAPASEGAGAKLQRALPLGIGERVKAIQAALELDADPWIVPASAALVIELAGAILDRSAVRIEYATRDGTSSGRDVEPYGMVYEDGRWYLVGHCRLRDAPRCFRVDRISSSTPLKGAPDGTFVMPEGFDARAHLLESLAASPIDAQVQVWLDVPVESARFRVFPAHASLEPFENGTLMRCGVDNLEWFAAGLLMLGCTVIVHEPPALCEAFSAVAERARAFARGPRLQSTGSVPFQV